MYLYPVKIYSVFLFLFSCVQLHGQILFREFKKTENEGQKIKLAHELWEYYLRNDTDSLKHLALDLFQFGEEKKNENSKMFSKRILGCYLIRQGDFIQGEKELKTALNFHRKNGDKANETEDLNELGISNFLKGDYFSAESFFKLSLKAGKDSPDKTHVILAELNLAKTYDKLGLFDKTKGIAKHYLQACETLKKWESSSMAYGFLSDLAVNEKNLPLAEEYLTKSLKAANKNNNSSILAQVYSNQGTFHANNGEYELAKEYFNKALDFRKKSNSKKGIFEAYYNLASLEYMVSNYLEAENILTKALKISENYNSLPDQMDFLELLVEVHKETKNKEKEIGYYKQFLDVKSKHSEQILKNKEDNEKLIEFFEQQTEKEAENLGNNSNFWSGFLVGGSCILFFILVYSFFKTKIDSNVERNYDA